MKSTYQHLSQERGILNSRYKQEIKENIQDFHQKSLSKIKSSILHQHHKIQSETGTILRVSFFAVILILLVL